MSDHITVIKNNRPLRMMVVARATDQLTNACKTSAITLFLYGIVAGNYKLSGGWTMYTTVRVIVRQAYTSSTPIKDIEEFLRYKEDSYEEFDLHLRLIREKLFKNYAVRQIIKNAIIYMFGEDYEFDFDRRQSDGVENIVNIYCSIIWVFTWDKDIESVEYDELRRYLCSTNAVVMIDEIEAFLHVYVQSRMLQKF